MEATTQRGASDVALETSDAAGVNRAGGQEV
jgi:hypothetical protein